MCLVLQKELCGASGTAIVLGIQKEIPLQFTVRSEMKEKPRRKMLPYYGGGKVVMKKLSINRAPCIRLKAGRIGHLKAAEAEIQAAPFNTLNYNAMLSKYVATSTER